ncbi:MAG: NAD-dependent epimerase/dehydratase family protein [Akkermansiaceae bacterium]|nr:NAD-dependent epimerase/dehydratase family protein [Akkermansiaceae bacterium]
MAKLLIAGYGFLGRALERKFEEAGWEVTKLNRSGDNGAIACDVSSAEELASLPEGYDLVIHCAASGGGGEPAYRKVYLQGARCLIERYPETRLIFTSSTSVYPQEDHSLVTELSAANPSSSGAQVLRETEQNVINAGGLVARLSGLYGPNRCHVLKNLLSGDARIDGAGERIMNYVHRDDVANAMLMLAELDVFPSGEIYNITAEPVSQRDCYAMLAEHFAVPMPEQQRQEVKRKRGNSSKRVSNTKLKSLGWQPEYDDFLSLSLACQRCQ